MNSYSNIYILFCLLSDCPEIWNIGLHFSMVMQGGVPELLQVMKKHGFVHFRNLITFKKIIKNIILFTIKKRHMIAKVVPFLSIKQIEEIMGN